MVNWKHNPPPPLPPRVRKTASLNLVVGHLHVGDDIEAEVRKVVGHHGGGALLVHQLHDQLEDGTDEILKANEHAVLVHQLFGLLGARHRRFDVKVQAGHEQVPRMRNELHQMDGGLKGGIKFRCMAGLQVAGEGRACLLGQAVQLQGDGVQRLGLEARIVGGAVGLAQDLSKLLDPVREHGHQKALDHCLALEDGWRIDEGER